MQTNQTTEKKPFYTWKLMECYSFEADNIQDIHVYNKKNPTFSA